MSSSNQQKIHSHKCQCCIGIQYGIFYSIIACCVLLVPILVSFDYFISSYGLNHIYKQEPHITLVSDKENNLDNVTLKTNLMKLNMIPVLYDIDHGCIIKQLDPATLMYNLSKPITMKTDKGERKIQCVCARLIDARGEFVQFIYACSSTFAVLLCICLFITVIILLFSCDSWLACGYTSIFWWTKQFKPQNKKLITHWNC